MITYKLFRMIRGRLYPLFVDANREMPLGQWLRARIGSLADETHVRSRIGPLALRPGFHSCEVPFTDWIGRKGADGDLYQRPDTVWCECEVEGIELHIDNRHGLRTIPDGWYHFCTKAGQPFPWIISDRIYIRCLLEHAQVEAICAEQGIRAQPLWPGGMEG